MRYKIFDRFAGVPFAQSFATFEEAKKECLQTFNEDTRKALEKPQCGQWKTDLIIVDTLTGKKTAFINPV